MLVTPASIPAELEIRRLSAEDLQAADELRSAEGWNQTKADWLQLVAYEPQGCFAAWWDQSLVGTVTTTRYGSELAWIGMMLVRHEYRGRGIGSALMRRALEFLQEARVGCIQLDATDDGKPVYQKLGFQEQWSFQRWSRDALPQANLDSKSSHPAPPEFQWHPSLAELDRAAFGANRHDWLQRVATNSVIVGSDEGFAMRRKGSKATYLGPATAANPTVARQLLGTLLCSVNGSVIWDVPGLNPEAQALASSLGFKPTRVLTRMAIGELRPPPDYLLQYAMFDPATG